MCLLPATDAAGARVVAERLRVAILERSVPVSDACIRVTVSLGSARCLALAAAQLASPSCARLTNACTAPRPKGETASSVNFTLCFRRRRSSPIARTGQPHLRLSVPTTRYRTGAAASLE